MINFSELLWKSGRPRVHGRKSASFNPSEEVQVVSALKYIPAEKAEIDPAGKVARLTDPRSPSADRFRYLQMRLHELRELAKLRSLAITSPVPEDGKSTIALSLATALAEGGKRSVLLIDGDMHRPSLVKSLGLQPRAGLAECLEDGLDPMEQIRKVKPLAWYLLQAGTPRDNPTELLQSDALSTVIQRVVPHFDWILIDTPPVLPLTDALSLSRQVDATLLVARAGRTGREAIEESLRLIGRKHVVGIVLNGAEGLNRLYSQYAGYYGKK